MDGQQGKISQLPCELVEHIAMYIDPKDLLNLRLVSKVIAAKSEKVMADTCFDVLQTMLAYPASLEKARNIAEHAILGKAVKLIGICVYQPALQKRTKDPVLMSTELSERTRSLRRERLRRRQLYTEELDDHAKLTSSDEYVNQLSAVFSSVRNNRDVGVSIQSVKM